MLATILELYYAKLGVCGGRQGKARQGIMSLIMTKVITQNQTMLVENSHGHTQAMKWTLLHSYFFFGG